MTFFRKLFGRETLEDLLAEAEQAEANDQPGIAKLALERARAKATDPATTARIDERILGTRDAIARARIAEARRLTESGHYEEALAEARGASEVAATEALRVEAETEAETVRKRHTSRGAVAVRQPTHEERVAAMTAGFTDARSIEYEPALESVVDGLLALEDGRYPEAIVHLERARERITPVYLHRDLASAYWAVGDLQASDAAYRAFFEAMGDSDDDETLFEVHNEHARMLEEAGRKEEAMVAIETALDHVGDSPTGFVVVARFFREHGYFAEAEEVLKAALALPGSEQDPIPHIELGLVEMALGKPDLARARLEQVVLAIRMTGREPPREVEAVRAQLLAEVEPLHAAEIHRRLANSGDDGLAFEQALLAAVAYRKAGHDPEAGRMLERASSLARGHAERMAAVEAVRAG